MIGCGLYVHVPYCETKCGYCDFYSLPLEQRPVAPLVDAMRCELTHRLAAAELPFASIFIGGGTPTILPPAQLQRLLDPLKVIAAAGDLVEFTMEANPATIEPATVRGLIESGVDRISLGGQSFHQQELDVLERLHHPEDIAPAIRTARQGGITRANLDLIFGIPGQTLDSWSDSLRRAIDLGVDHLSCYGLTYEPGTPLHARVQSNAITPCDPDLEAEMYLACVEILAAHGFEQYEISSYARPGCHCRHNLIYWNQEPYLGIGPSATSYLQGIRSKNVPHVETYIRDIAAGRPPWRQQEQLRGGALAGETMMLQLRLNCGVDVPRFKDRVGLDPMELFGAALSKHARAGLLTCSDAVIRLTPRGRLLADRVIRDLLPDPGDLHLPVLNS